MAVVVAPAKTHWLVRYWRWSRYGFVNARLACPHCGERGQIRTKLVRRKKGMSGGKAVGAVLTGGLSLLATGIARKERMTQCKCDSCTSQWDF